MQDERDSAMRMEAFATVRRLNAMHADLSFEQLHRGFRFGEEQIPLLNKPRGIFRPRQMRYLLSIKTTVPRQGRKVWYDDQRVGQLALLEGVDAVDYAFQGDDPNSPDNRLLREAMEKEVPILYFVGVAPGRYLAIVGAFVVGWDSARRRARICTSESGTATQHQVPDAAERRYSLRTQKQRLHQATFRAMVMSAYDSCCAFSGVREELLLDAAHIIRDREELGQPVVGNGLLLTKTHHAAYDGKLIGVDQDYQIHVAPRLMKVKDGPTLEALKKLDGQGLKLPKRVADRPDRDRLALSFSDFSAAM